MAIITVDEAGDNTIVLSPGANGHLEADTLDGLNDVLREADVLCLCLEVPVESVLMAARRAQHYGVRVVLNLSPYGHVPSELLRLTDLLVVNGNEAAALVNAEGELTPSTDWERTYETIRGKGIERAVVTLGSDGSVVLDGAVTPIPPVRVRAVDTVGSGDAYTGAIAARMADGAGLVDAARFASRAGAWAATHSGAQGSYATLQELLDWRP